ncbi:MAG: hypothetical protein IKX74_04325 [Erysipelotrichaceae bacterium]|nr:hypothetical protein [Erysipelotrichaceae bacterium]MBR5048846.1 hypothetical protein [Erysipelotrichaceae bacterium]
MNKLKEFWEIESARRCPVCKSEDIKSVMVDGLPYGECQKCGTHFKNYGFSWLELLYTFLGVVLTELLLVKVFIPNNVNRITTMVVVILLFIVVRETLAFVIYLIFGKTKVTVAKHSAEKGDK